MKSILTSFFCLCLMLTLSRAQGQSEPQNPIIGDPHPFDAFYGDLPLEDEQARLDNLAVALKHDKEHIAYILLYAGRRACAGETRVRAVRMKIYLVNRHGIRPKRIVWKDGGHHEEVEVIFLIWTPSVAEPTVFPTVSPNDVIFKKCKSKSTRRGQRRTRSSN